MSARLPVVVVGAGVGGLSAAIHLACAGRRVVVLEAGGRVGGKMNEIVSDGFRWDTGPSVITMRHVLEALFAAAGRRMADYLTLEPIDPLTRYLWRDGTVFDPSPDLTRTLAGIAAIDPRDVEGYLGYLAYAARIHRITGDKFIYGTPPTLLKLLNTPPLDMLAVDPLRTMHGAIASFVRSAKMRQFLGRFATYVGASPYRAPATLNVIAHVELSGGVYYPRGGIYAIARALERLAGEVGVEVRLHSPVTAISVRDGRARGVTLADGTNLDAEAVIANVDVATVYDRLLPADPARARRRRALLGAEASCSGFILLLGVEGEDARLAHHNILFSDDYRREFDDIFARGVPPSDPTVYIAITSKTDPDHAPAGCENWFVLVNAPPLDGRFVWDEANTAAYRDRVLATMAAHGFDVRGRVRTMHTLTPADLERLSGARRGALYGAGSNDRFSALRRPHNRDPLVRGLYFAGGTAHPGGGVPMVTLSGAAAAAVLLEDLP